jgi:hypothetical protein
VAQGRDGARLALEARAAVGVGRELARQHLDRDQAVEPGVTGREDLDLVGTEPLARELLIPDDCRLPIRPLGWEQGHRTGHIDQDPEG